MLISLRLLKISKAVKCEENKVCRLILSDSRSQSTKESFSVYPLEKVASCDRLCKKSQGDSLQFSARRRTRDLTKANSIRYSKFKRSKREIVAALICLIVTNSLRWHDLANLTLESSSKHACMCCMFW